MALNDLKPDAVLEEGAWRLAAFLGDTCIASLLTDDRRWIRPLGLADPDPEVAQALRPVRGDRWRADRGFTRRVLESLRALRLSETSPEVVVVGRPELADYGRRFGIASVIVAPMRVAGSSVGNIAVIRRRPDHPHSANDEAVAQAMADLVGFGARLSARQPEAATDGVPLDITSREREVLALVAAGHTNREIAEKLVLSVRTVEWHRARLQWKLGVTGRAALVDLARAHGIVR
ncbi:LuxR C-terminal-related transcriptional regulator [Solirubrobacter soli]|uniref:LuxR C-terminal-related transcriptional regulator n=1 Tax=Solirubrobacter soli TaxID=363832 RepID=UPI001FDFD543|nr:LuxR C-terminal-related transcriptional regulator [Solirubrobacter soli]